MFMTGVTASRQIGDSHGHASVWRPWARSVAGSALAAGIVPGDARRGEELFKSEQCIQCHSVNGKGGTTAPDLAKTHRPRLHARRDGEPDVEPRAGYVGGHEEAGIVKAELTPESAADLFAYFVSARYFEKPGDAGRGKREFTAKHCADVPRHHTGRLSRGAPPVAQWESLADPVVLAQQMWNHGAAMREAFAKKKLAWASSPRRNSPTCWSTCRTCRRPRGWRTTSCSRPADAGAALFQSKGCAGCHIGKLALETRLHNQTLTEIAVDMWNHQPSMKQPPPSFRQEEMRQITGYIWARQYFSGDGNAERGKKVFAEKSCATCHNAPGGGAPKLAKGKDAYSDITMVSALWEHGPRMLELMNQRKIAWPRFTAQQMADLIAYLNSL